MKRFREILFINDGKTEREATLQRAVDLAKRNQASLTVVEVLEKFRDGTRALLKPVDVKGFEKAAIKESAERLATLIAPIKEEGVRAGTKVLQGTHFLEIIREVVRNNHDLVMMSPRKKAKLTEQLFGSRIMHLMRKCPCPVWAIKPTKRKKYARILAAVDPAPFDDERDALNIKIMELATSLAGMEGSELHVVHCWTSTIEKAKMRTRIGFSMDAVKKLVRETRKIHKTHLDQLLGRFDLEQLAHKVHLLKGAPDELIVDLARKKRIELVVMGTVCRTGLSGFFIGNTAEKVLQEVDCSVLALKPDGFETPVRLDQQ